jgi:pimeloyl-ACP methyl ester carboxylesterase
LVQAARTIETPALLVRGGSSELVTEAHAREFLELVPHAEYVDLSGARHMVAGDQNDDFAAAILGFLGRIKGGSGEPEGGLRPAPPAGC